MPNTILAGLAALLVLQTAAPPCDPRLVTPGNDPNGYRLRGDRCEGLYVQPIAGSASLLVASFVAAFADFDARRVVDLRLDWTPASPFQPTFIRAYGLRRRQYYRMDTARAPGVRSFTWPATILGNLSLSRQFLGIVAWNEMDVGAQPRRVYVPLRIGAGAAVAGGYELALVPSVELTEVYVSVAAVDGDGRTQRSYVQRRPLGFGYYPAQEPIRIPVAGLEQAGLHRIDIAVTQRDGGSANAEVWFVHAGR